MTLPWGNAGGAAEARSGSAIAAAAVTSVPIASRRVQPEVRDSCAITVFLEAMARKLAQSGRRWLPVMCQLTRGYGRITRTFATSHPFGKFAATGGRLPA